MGRNSMGEEEKEETDDEVENANSDLENELDSYEYQLVFPST